MLRTHSGQICVAIEWPRMCVVVWLTMCLLSFVLQCNTGFRNVCLHTGMQMILVFFKTTIVIWLEKATVLVNSFRKLFSLVCFVLCTSFWKKLFSYVFSKVYKHKRGSSAGA